MEVSMEGWMNRRPERGYTLLEILVALGVAILAIGIPVMVLAATGHGFARQSVSTVSTAAVDGLLDTLHASAHTSVAIYTPASCGGGAHGDDQACNSVRFFGKDSAGNPHYWGWDLSGTTLTECLSYSSPDGACTKAGSSIRNVTAFTATPRTVSEIASTLGLSAPTSKEYEMNSTAADPSGRQVAGNRIMVVDVATAIVNREVHLLQAGAPFTTSLLRGAFIAPTTQTLGVAKAFVFAGPTAPPQAATASELGYSAFQSLPQYAAWYWNIAACTSGGTTVATISYNATQAGDTLNYTVTPANAGSCSMKVSTRDQSFTDTVTVNTPSTPTPSPSPKVSGTLSFSQNPLQIAAGGYYGSANDTASDTQGAVSALTLSSTTCDSGITETSSGSTITVTNNGDANGYSCTQTYSDNFGDSATLTVTITAARYNWHKTSLYNPGYVCGAQGQTCSEYGEEWDIYDTQNASAGWQTYCTYDDYTTSGTGGVSYNISPPGDCDVPYGSQSPTVPYPG